MTRAMDAAVITATQQAVIRPVVLFDGDFPSGHLRLFSGTGYVTYNDNLFTGWGSLGKISAIEEGVELSASGLSVSLSGLPGAIVSTALGEHYQGRLAVLYIAMLDEDYQVIGSPVVLFRGRMDNMPITLGTTCDISLNIENPLRDWERPKERRYNNADQQAVWPGDKGLEFVEQTVKEEITWGANSRKKVV